MIPGGLAAGARGRQLSAFGAAGASCTGAGARVFGAGGFLGADGAAPLAGCEEISCAFAVDGGERGAGMVGSGVMMLTGGIEAALGKSAVVGLPVAPGDGCGGAAAIAPAALGGGCGSAATVAEGAFHDGA